MKIYSATSVAAKIGITFITFFRCYMCVCDVYFSNLYEFVCVTENNINTAHYENFYLKLITRCAENEIQHNKIPIATKSWIFRSIDCTWESHIFEKFGPSEVQFFRTGEQNPNSILQDYMFLGLCNIQSAVLRSANIKSIEPNAFDCLTKIYYLDLSQNRIDVLPTYFMKEMTGLKMLNLSYNSIKTLERGMFDNQQKLFGLDLTGNKISILPDGIFYGLPNLKDLLLGKNEIEYLGHFPFSNMTQLQKLSLRENKLKSVENAFWQNSGLKFLRLSDNEIKSISKKVFSETKRLTSIYLSSNQLDQVTPEIFGDLQHLENLDLSYNQIVELKDEPFANNGELKELDLTGNKLVEIKSGDFRGLHTLQTLYLSSNSIAGMSIGSFKDMLGLQNLALNSNLLSDLHTDVSNRSPFSNTAIRRLLLTDNVLKNISNGFHNTSITHLDISNNTDLIMDSDTFAGLINLKTLHMKNCNVISIPDGVFANTPELSNVVLQYNKMLAITPDTFASLNIRVLDLSFNNIEELTNHTFIKCKSLAVLNVSHNSISKIEEDVFGGTLLKTLDLKSNLLADIPLDAPGLNLLYVSHNSIASLEGVLKISQQLQFLDVSFNNLSDVTTEQWMKIVQLRQFSAKGNYIQEVIIPEVDKVFCVIELEHNKVRKIYMPDILERKEDESEFFRVLDLGNNKVKLVPFTTILVYLEDNPIECDCSAYKLYKYLINFNYTRDYVYFPDNIVCYNPFHLRGRKLIELEPTDLICNYAEDCTYFGCQPTAYDCLKNCSCLYRPHDEFRSVNCSHRDFDSLPRHVVENTNVLDLDNNRLSSLVELNHYFWENLTEINVENNAVDSDVFYIPESVEFLGLKGNRLRKFPHSIRVHANKTKDFKVTLSGNLFQCDCSAVPLKEFLLTHENQVVDIDDVECISSDNSLVNMANLTYSDLCPSEIETTISTAMYYVGAAIFIVSVAISIFCFKYELYILSYLYTHCNVCYRLLCCSRKIDEDKIFDGFIAYSSEDGEVAVGIMQELEPQYQLCIHERNWMPGTLITNNIIYSVKNSRKTLVVLSKTFLESKWFYLEFEAAFNQTLWDKTDRMILILKGKLPDSSKLPDNVKYVLKTKTYLEWGEKWFFEKLRYAMEEQRPFTIKKKSDGLRRFFNRFWKRTINTQQDIELQV